MAKLAEVKRKKGKALTPADKKKLVDALVLIKATYGDVLSVWGECTEMQKQAYLADSPVLAELLGWSELWRQ